jgi:hypothetical protein
MSTVTENAGMDPALKAKMQEACERIAKGVMPTLEERKAATAAIDRMREENAKRFGIQNVAVELLRQARGSSDMHASLE